MQKSELAKRIIIAVEDLENAKVSDFNKKVLEDLKDAEFVGEIDENAVGTLTASLHSFLDKTWPEEPLAHKYVIAACLALSFLFEKPMHPQEKVHFIVRIENGKEAFYCPYNEKNTLCDYCAAAPLEVLAGIWEDQTAEVQKEYGTDPAFILKTILQSGFQEAGIIPVEELKFNEDVRKICEGNQCRCYGRTWACPPAAGSLEDCRNRVLKYRYMFLFSKAYKLEDSFDIENMRNGIKDFKEAARTLDKKLNKEIGQIQILSNESCDRCKVCTYPDEPCRFPDDLHHSIEGYGFYVNELAKQAGIAYMNGPGTVTFFGAVLH